MPIEVLRMAEDREELAVNALMELSSPTAEESSDNPNNSDEISTSRSSPNNSSNTPYLLVTTANRTVVICSNKSSVELKSAYPFLSNTNELILGREGMEPPGIPEHSIFIAVGPDTYLSRKHLVIKYFDEKQAFYLETFSKNGAIVNDQYLNSNMQWPVSGNCTIQFPSCAAGVQIIKHSSSCNQVTPSVFSFPPAQLVKQEPVATSQIPTDAAQTRTNHSPFETRPSSPVFDPEVSQVVDQLINIDTNGTFDDSFEAEADFRKTAKKPPYSYAQLIIQAIATSSNRRATLSTIYSNIKEKYPFFQASQKGWQNSIRHNLSLNRYFIKMPRPTNEGGKGCFWKLDEKHEAHLIQQAWRKRRHRTIEGFGRNFRDATLTAQSGKKKPKHLEFYSAPPSPSRFIPHNEFTMNAMSTLSSRNVSEEAVSVTDEPREAPSCEKSGESDEVKMKAELLLKVAAMAQQQIQQQNHLAAALWQLKALGPPVINTSASIFDARNGFLSAPVSPGLRTPYHFAAGPNHHTHSSNMGVSTTTSSETVPSLFPLNTAANSQLTPQQQPQAPNFFASSSSCVTSPQSVISPPGLPNLAFGAPVLGTSSASHAMSTSVFNFPSSISDSFASKSD